jgi:hypothetical protein
VFSIPQNNQSEKKFGLAYWPIRVDLPRSGTALRVLSEIIASDVLLLVTFNHAIDKCDPEQSKGAGSIGRVQEAAGEITVGKSSAVSDGEGSQIGIATGDHCRNEWRQLRHASPRINRQNSTGKII